MLNAILSHCVLVVEMKAQEHFGNGASIGGCLDCMGTQTPLSSYLHLSIPFQLSQRPGNQRLGQQGT